MTLHPASLAGRMRLCGLRGGRLFYDIGWLGVVTGKRKNLADGQAHDRCGIVWILDIDGTRPSELIPQPGSISFIFLTLARYHSLV